MYFHPQKCMTRLRFKNPKLEVQMVALLGDARFLTLSLLSLLERQQIEAAQDKRTFATVISSCLIFTALASRFMAATSAMTELEPWAIWVRHVQIMDAPSLLHRFTTAAFLVALRTSESFVPSKWGASRSAARVRAVMARTIPPSPPFQKALECSRLLQKCWNNFPQIGCGAPRRHGFSFHLTEL